MEADTISSLVDTMACMVPYLSNSKSLVCQQQVCPLSVGTIRWCRLAMVVRTDVPTINSIHICSHIIHLLAVYAPVLQWNLILLSYATTLN